VLALAKIAQIRFCIFAFNSGFGPRRFIRLRLVSLTAGMCFSSAAIQGRFQLGRFGCVLVKASSSVIQQAQFPYATISVCSLAACRSNECLLYVIERVFRLTEQA
jgi:hypothetical protein